ncbi:hypothetical protein [Roseovarius sp. Pro17]|uniref:hypothetical protein n=1 Tax=Roseovarius sp. Pro17 TaxID=3108175 RepID=UPI002D78D1B0|nr:hypothetical protein [Roseovarius sp. Pro17]
MAFASKAHIPEVGKELNFKPNKTSLAYTRTAEFFARAGILLCGISIAFNVVLGSGWDWLGVILGISGIVSSVILGVLAEISRSVASLREL